MLASLRLNLRDPQWGDAGTLGAGIVVLLAAGSVKSDGSLPLTLVAFAVLGFAALRVEALEKKERGSLASLGIRHGLAGMGVIVTTVCLSLVLATTLPRLYTAAYFWALSQIGHRGQTGFHDGPIQLGTLEGLLESWRVVMRVTGHPGDQLRGNVYTHYASGSWRTTPDPREETMKTREPEAPSYESAISDIRFAGGQSDRFFLPAGSGRFYLQPNSVLVDRMGVVRTDGEEMAERMVILPDSRRIFPIAPPDSDDLQLPGDIREVLVEISQNWTVEGFSPSDQLAAIQNRLESEFVYSLDFSRTGSPAKSTSSTDPMLDFLLRDRRGHCEYFASAMTLMARASGFPARLVTGYRIAEYNSLGDYYIVRERHAHAWSEIFLPERGWVTFDPSPLVGTALAEDEITPTWRALMDYASVLWQRRGLEFLLVLLVLGLSAAQIWRLATRKSPKGGGAEDAFPDPPIWIDALLRRLAEGGTPRRPNESLESLARRNAVAPRTEASPQPPNREGARLLFCYAALRYGREGRSENLRREVEDWLEGVRPPAR